MNDAGLLVSYEFVLFCAAAQIAGYIILWRRLRVRDRAFLFLPVTLFALFFVASTYIYKWAGFWETGVIPLG